ncbi:beta-1,3-galactosyltransferase 5-like [Daphnia carinata]|uniref:beta-1,3-galactosyltransferase 5-like n=1 Tax=Daphnia carinata TaxID=120202 RepID=UPI002868CF2D|nr:beta-1,3-galactosyltransferase 5-like [Daphnia carinata]
MSYPGVEAHTRYAASRSALSALTGVEPLVPGFGPVINHVFPFRYRISIPPCPDFFPKDSRTVFVAVISASHHFEKRRAIRNTWRTHLNAAAQEDGPLPISVGFAFVLGLPNDDETQSRIEEENDLHGDIIQIEMADVYNSLPRKVLGTLNWLHANCSKVDFAFKVDDDVYVNVRNLVQFVRNHHRSYHSVFGYGNFDRVPMRLGDAMSPEHVKWTITFEEYPWNTYPNYMSGPAYVLHGSTIRLLLAACQTTPMIRLEDVYITSMCAEKAGVKMQFSVGPSWVYFDPGRMVPTACGLRQYIAWPSENHTHSHTAVENFYSLNKTRCETINADGTYTPVDPHEPVHFRFSQTKTPASSTMIEQN